MRYTAKTHPNHRVYLDGVEVHLASQCDDTEGWVEVFVQDSDGNFRVDPRSPLLVYTEVRWGTIKVEPIT